MPSGLLPTLVAPLIAAGVAAFLTNYLSARFTFKRFRQEQWWQEKRRAYEDIIRALSEALFDSSLEMERIGTGGEIQTPRGPRRTQALSWTLQDIASSGAYVVSDKTVEAVQSVLKVWASSYALSGGEPFAEAERDYVAARDALNVIRAEAHRELGIAEPRRSLLNRITTNRTRYAHKKKQATGSESASQ